MINSRAKEREVSGSGEINSAPKATPLNEDSNSLEDKTHQM
jgi:hypothetical protein